MSSATAFAPATVANVGSAFDVLGFALEHPGDCVHASVSASSGVRILGIEGDGGRLPRDPLKNTAGVSVRALLDHLVAGDASLASLGLDLTIRKGLPIGSGLGSSSASAVAAVVAANAALGEPLARSELLPFAMEGERVACGTAHADNVAPALLGGFVLIRSYEPLDVVMLPAPPQALVVVATPHIELNTHDARRVLRRSVPLSAAVAQWGNVAALVAGIFQGDVALMGRALEDKIIEPERSQLIPGFSAVKSAALDAGALGCSISGSGPSIFALCRSRQSAERVGESMQLAFSQVPLSATVHVSPVNPLGATIVARG